MQKRTMRNYAVLLGSVLGGWILIRYGLPILLPFLLGAGIALAAEPLVTLLHQRVHLPRWLASGIGVSAVFAVLLVLLVMLVAFLIRELGQVSALLPDLAWATRHGLGNLEGWLLGWVARAPGDVRVVLTDSVTNLFSGGSAMMDRVVKAVLHFASRVLSRVPDGVLGLGTGMLSAFMISARMPQWQDCFHRRVSAIWKNRYLPALQGIRQSLGGWFTAQVKLAGVTFLVLFLGFWALHISYAPLWAMMVALIDAFPVFGTGMVLIPWGTICLLQGQQVRGMGLLGIYVLVWLIRSVLEPKLLGKELGLDPLVTLIAMYAGYQLFGLLGMIVSPMVAVVILRLIHVSNGEVSS